MEELTSSQQQHPHTHSNQHKVDIAECNDSIDSPDIEVSSLDQGGHLAIGESLCKSESAVSIGTAESSVRESLKCLVETFQQVLKPTEIQKQEKDTHEPSREPSIEETVLESERIEINEIEESTTSSPLPEEADEEITLTILIEGDNLPTETALEPEESIESPQIQLDEDESNPLADLIAILKQSKPDYLTPEKNVPTDVDESPDLAEVIEKEKREVMESGPEIKEENIKKQLTEIINEIDKVVAAEAYLTTQQNTNGDDVVGGEKISQEKSTPADDTLNGDVPHLPTDDGEVSPSYHNTEAYRSLEEQVNLARGISKSITEPQNQKSKGQSMYVRRREKSNNWVHEGPDAVLDDAEEEIVGECQNANSHFERERTTSSSKSIMKLVMNPLGQLQDLNSLSRSGSEPYCGDMSPEVCHNLVRDLQSPSSKGGELFAKRVKKSEDWIKTGMEEIKLTYDPNPVRSSPNLLPDFEPSSLSYIEPITNTIYEPQPYAYQRPEHFNRLHQNQHLVQSQYSQSLPTASVKLPWSRTYEHRPPVSQPIQNFPVYYQQPPTQNIVNALVEAAEKKLVETSIASRNWLPPKIPVANSGYRPETCVWTTKAQLPPTIIYPAVQPTSCPVPIPSSPNPRNLQFGNYNTAPRGFTYGARIYHPVSFH